MTSQLEQHKQHAMAFYDLNRTRRARAATARRRGREAVGSDGG